MNLHALVLLGLICANPCRRLQRTTEETIERDPTGVYPRQESKLRAIRLLKTFLWANARAGMGRRTSRTAEPRVSSLINMVSRRKLPRIAIVGRPNVGKSCVYNRMGDGSAIVFDKPGVTRDVNVARCDLLGMNCTLCDTGGIIMEDEIDGSRQFLREIREVAFSEILKADVVVMVVDGQAGLTGLDIDLADYLRKSKKPIVVAVNKCESHTVGDAQVHDFHSLGLGTPYPVSALHGTGMWEMMEGVTQHLKTKESEPEPRKYDDEITIALLGRPNSGKSTLLNRLTGSNRSIVSPVAGTTVDSVDQDIVRDNVKYTIVDTAGVRRKKSIGPGVEEQMVQRSLKAVRRADVAIIVIDADEGVNEQEARLASFIADSGTACVVVVNKWDLIAEKDDRLYRESKRHLQKKLADVSWAKPLFISAKTGLNHETIFAAVKAAAEQHRRRVSTAILNEVLDDIVRRQKPASTSRGKQGTIYYGAQVAIKPPTVALFCNDPALFPQNYERFLAKQLRRSFGFEGSPLRLYWKGKSKRDVMAGK